MPRLRLALFVSTVALAAAQAAPTPSTQVVTSTFSRVKRTVQLTVPADYGYCAQAGCGRIEGAVPEDACANRAPIQRCYLNFVSPEPKDMLPRYLVASATMPSDGDRFNYSSTEAKWVCKKDGCTAVDHDTKNQTLDIARAIAVGGGQAIIIEGRLMMVSDRAAPRLRKQMEATLKSAAVRN